MPKYSSHRRPRPWLRLSMLLLPAAALWLVPLVWYLIYQPTFLIIAAVSAAALSGILMYAILLMMWSDITHPLRRAWSNLRYRWLTRHIDRKMKR